MSYGDTAEDLLGVHVSTLGGGHSERRPRRQYPSLKSVLSARNVADGGVGALAGNYRSGAAAAPLAARSERHTRAALRATGGPVSAGVDALNPPSKQSPASTPLPAASPAPAPAAAASVVAAATPTKLSAKASLSRAASHTSTASNTPRLVSLRKKPSSPRLKHQYTLRQLLAGSNRDLQGADKPAHSGTPASTPSSGVMIASQRLPKARALRPERVFARMRTGQTDTLFVSSDHDDSDEEEEAADTTQDSKRNPGDAAVAVGVKGKDKGKGIRPTPSWADVIKGKTGSNLAAALQSKMSTTKAGSFWNKAVSAVSKRFDSKHHVDHCALAYA